MPQEVCNAKIDLDIHSHGNVDPFTTANAIMDLCSLGQDDKYIVNGGRVLTSNIQLFSSSTTSAYGNEDSHSFATSMWTDMLAFDALSLLMESKKRGEVRMEGKRFCDAFMNRSVSREEVKSRRSTAAAFREFRGRDASILPLLQQRGIEKMQSPEVSLQSPSMYFNKFKFWLKSQSGDWDEK